MIKVDNIKIEYATLLFENVSFLIGNKEKIGLVGLNGCGKSTLLKIINSEIQPDEGRMEILGETISYLPQQFKLNESEYVGEYLESLVEDLYSQFWEVDIALSKLGLKLINDGRKEAENNLQPIDYFSKLGSLSEGQKMKMYLAKLMMQKPTVLLLDEPTNHLDIDGIEWLEGFVSGFSGICIIISHDRSFINNSVNWIYEIDNRKLNKFKGNYDDYLEQKEKLIESNEEAFKRWEKKKQQLEKLIANSRKIRDAKKRGKAVNAAKKRMAREVEADNVKVDKYEENKLSGVSLEGFVHKAKTLFKFENLSFGYSEDTMLLKNLDFRVYGNEKIWFYGSNGIGKTTLVKLLTGELEPTIGSVKIGDGIKWAYFSQTQSHIPLDITVREYLMKYGGVSYDSSFGLLEKFLFTKEMQDVSISNLSPGQRARISIATFAQHENELLILDEPTNHLDIQTKEVIEETLREYKGGILLISHDRYFVASVGITKSITIEDGRIVE